MAAENAELIISGDTSDLGKDLDDQEKQLDAFWRRLDAVMQGMADKIGANVSAAVAGSMGQMNASLEASLKRVESSFRETSDVIKQSTESWTDWLVKWFVYLKAINVVLAPFVWAFKAIFGLITATISTFVKGVIALISGLFSTIISVVKGVTNGVVGAFKAVFSLVEGTVTGVVKFVVKQFNSILSAFTSQMPLLSVSLSEGLKAGFESLMDLEKVQIRLNALLKSTGELAGFTSAAFNKMAKELQRVTTFSKEAALAGATMLTRFFNIRGDVLEDTLKVAADLAIVLGTDLASAAQELGSALNNPIEGVKKLRDMGLLLWDHEMALVQALTMTGRVAEAQRFLLEKLSQHIGGAAAEAAKMFWGQIQKANNALTEMWETIADSLVPFLEKLIPYVISSSEEVMRWAENFKELTPAILAWAESTLPTVKHWFESVLEYAKTVFRDIVDFAVQAYTVFETAWQNAPEAFKAVSSAAQVMAQKVKVYLMEIWEGHFDNLEMLWEKVALFAKKALLDALKPVAAMIDHLLNLASGGKMKFKPASFMLDFERAGVDAEQEKQAKDHEARSKRRKEESEDLKKARDILADLEKEAAKVQAPFWGAFDKNLDKNKKAVDSAIDWIQTQIGELTKPSAPEDTSNKRGNRGRPGVPFLLPTSRTAGNFEALEALNKRIQSAAAKSPEIMLMQQQNDMMRQQHRDQKVWSDEQRKATLEVGSKLADTFKNPPTAVYA